MKLTIFLALASLAVAQPARNHLDIEFSSQHDNHIGPRAMIGSMSGSSMRWWSPGKISPGAAGAGAVVGGAIGGKNGAVKGGSVGASLGLSTQLISWLDGKFEHTAEVLAEQEGAVTMELMRSVAQDYEQHPENYRVLLQDPIWRDAIDTALQLARTPESELVTPSAETANELRTLWLKAARVKYALYTGVGIGALGAIPFAVDRLLGMVELVKPGDRDSKEPVDAKDPVDTQETVDTRKPADAKKPAYKKRPVGGQKKAESSPEETGSSSSWTSWISNLFSSSKDPSDAKANPPSKSRPGFYTPRITRVSKDYDVDGAEISRPGPLSSEQHADQSSDRDSRRPGTGASDTAASENQGNQSDSSSN